MFGNTAYLLTFSKRTRLQGNYLHLMGAATLMFVVHGCGSKTVTVKGTVFDGKTERPAPKARAIVTVINEEGLKTLQIERYGLVANDEGELDAVIHTSIPARSVQLEICTEQGGYAVMDLPSPGFSISSGEVAEKYEKMYENNKGEPWMEYERFSGASQIFHDDPISFVDRPWPAYSR